MTHILIATDLLTLGLGFICLIVFIMLIGGFSQAHIRPYRRRYRRGFLHHQAPTQPLIGFDLLDQLHQTSNQDDLSIYKTHDNTSDSTHVASSGSILGLNDGTEPRSIDDFGTSGGLGAAAAEYLNSDNSSMSDWSSGGSFGDSSNYSSDNGSSFSDNSSFSDSGSSFSDSSSGGSFSNDN